MRRTMGDVEHYIALINSRMEQNGSAYRYYARSRNGYKALDLGYDHDTRIVNTIRAGLTTGELYDCVYAIFQSLVYMESEGIIK